MATTTSMEPSTSRPMAYTANPMLLIANDLVLFLQITFTRKFTAGLLSTVLPLWPDRANALDELAFTADNMWDVCLHTFLIIAHSAFLLSLIPLALFGLPAFYVLYIVAVVVGNKYFTVLLNGHRQNTPFLSHPDCVKGKPKHDKEKWVFINGVSVGSHWLQSNLDLLAMTFRRPVLGIHNQTRGIIFDVIECIIQRDLMFATTDVRDAYAVLVDVLADKNIEKVVLVLHSQGGIEGSMILDWLYDTVPAQQLGKLEIYTFGNAANHWNAPIITSSTTDGRTDAIARQQRIVKHIEHYANEGDYVSKFGVLHFRPNDTRNQQPATTPLSDDIPPTPPTTSTRVESAPVSATVPHIKTQLTKRSSTWTPTPSTPIERSSSLHAAKDNNRFFGRLFKRASSGHLLNMHYLDTMFEMEGVESEDLSKGKVKEGNGFMDSEIDMSVFGIFDTVQCIGEEDKKEPKINGGGQVKRVKDCSRLWGYRNGLSPAD